jgi:hypothetical protein
MKNREFIFTGIFFVRKHPEISHILVLVGLRRSLALQTGRQLVVNG